MDERAAERQRRLRMQRKRRKQRQSLMVLVVGLILITACAFGLNAWMNRGSDAMRGEANSSMNSGETAENESSRGENLSAEAENQISQNLSTIENQVYTAKIATVGDIMVHDTQLEFAYDDSTGGFDFSDSFAMIKDELSAPDFTIGNLETTFGGVDTWTADAVHGYTGYPCFNSPDILATNLKDAGFDFLGTANNHSLDSRQDGLLRTVQVLRGINMPSTGTFTELDAPRYSVQEVGGIRIAIMAYTYGANGFELPEESKGYFNTFDDYEQSKIDQMYRDVSDAAAQKDVDLVAVMLHMGEEYQYEPTAKTREVVDELFKAGCDIVFGSHPHVLEPFELRTITDEDGTSRQGLVIYSLGNFISSQYYTSETPVHKDVGVIMSVDLEKHGQQKPVITGLRFMPTYCQWTTSTIRVIPIEKALDSYTGGDNLYSVNDSCYQKLLAAQEFFRSTFWPEEYAYTIEDGNYVVTMP